MIHRIPIVNKVSTAELTLVTDVFISLYMVAKKTERNWKRRGDVPILTRFDDSTAFQISFLRDGKSDRQFISFYMIPICCWSSPRQFFFRDGHWLFAKNIGRLRFGCSRDCIVRGALIWFCPRRDNYKNGNSIHQYAPAVHTQLTKSGHRIRCLVGNVSDFLCQFLFQFFGSPEKTQIGVLAWILRRYSANAGQ